MAAGQRGKRIYIYLYCAIEEEPKEKNDFPSVIQPMLTVKTGGCSRPKSSGGYEKAPRRHEPIFLPALLSLLLVSFSLCIYYTGVLI